MTDQLTLPQRIQTWAMCGCAVILDADQAKELARMAQEGLEARRRAQDWEDRRARQQRSLRARLRLSTALVWINLAMLFWMLLTG